MGKSVQRVRNIKDIESQQEPLEHKKLSNKASNLVSYVSMEDENDKMELESDGPGLYFQQNIDTS